ncbi:MAG TPA: hypothetical protein VN455_06700 [Methanotrichaceae archaeon]|nr:hypothetical protein [Methanotrichaceae archaeon]
MVNDLLIRYRALGLFPQALIAGATFLVIYTPYLYFVNHMTILQAARVSLSSSLLFLSVFYLTSVLMARKKVQMETQMEGGVPKKGLRKK